MDVECGDQVNLVSTVSGASNQQNSQRQKKLDTFEGVFTPVCLAMFSAILFLRLGFILGNAGLLETLLQMFIAYTILIFTILSISAISTNGAIEGGGIYFMSSRVLGPEFGGAIGLLFFIANIVSSALYLTGCVEGLMNNFGPNGTMANFLPGGEDLPLVYASIINMFNLVVCIFGARMFAKTTLVIFSVVASVALSVIMSLLFMPAKLIPIVKENHIYNTTNMTQFTGLSWQTFESNLYPSYGADYTTNLKTDFANVFGVFFTGVTGVLAGANISGDLKDPAKSIPLGTLSGIACTFLTYVSLFVLSAASCSRELLQNNYLYMQYTNVWPPLVEIGISSATISAALTNLIGASRLLNAVAADRLFGWFLDPIYKANVQGNPIGSVLMTWFIIQLMLLVGSLNQIAQISSILFLFTYFSINISCMLCLLTSTPNFRPSFKYFSLVTTVLGLVGASGMTFVINPLYSSLVIIVWMLLMIGIHLSSPPLRWGDITQALIFHQVRKYLLLLDLRKEHVKFWRPRILLMVENPRSCLPLIEFVNDLKKSGLFVIGHIEVGSLDSCEVDPVIDQYQVWLKWLDRLTIKAFIEMTLATSVREGFAHIIRIAGLGALKLNTVIFGFYDDTIPIDFLQEDPRYQALEQVVGGGSALFKIRPNERMSKIDYVSMIRNSMTKLQKTVCLARNFHLLDTKRLSKKNNPDNYKYIDVWPINFFNLTDTISPDNCANMIMQLACVLNMVPRWKSAASLRLLIISDHTNQEKNFIQWQKQLTELRIEADLSIIIHEVDREMAETSNNGDDDERKWSSVLEQHIKPINRMLVDRSQETAVSFLYLPKAPKSEKYYENYLESLTMLTENMPPSLLIHGNDQVVSTSI